MLRTQIIKIGNSRGIRLPKVLIEQVGLGSEVEISIEGNTLVLRPVGQARQGWDAGFAAMAEHQDDHLLDETISSQWDESEWEWA
jgi:antitoxin MazE